MMLFIDTVGSDLMFLLICINLRYVCLASAVVSKLHQTGGSLRVVSAGHSCNGILTLIAG